ncbi:baseplate multidomain protein megatron [Roseitranquillus sediminis]|uniref:baseplate multidomain protein megatron n=1 Tax=Roseitranquillus sediminis TaxID=2809051 RepID=UPI001D0C75B8|nr:glycoside hydrolase/phage tail family protein [Roseitranquillus sediminis]MBM9595201.1 glycoside hydrolase/phage tail family protein [Roseitranquillus sediminis]
MATLVLSAAGAASGGMFGFSAFGLTSTMLGRALGATAGRIIDQRILGEGSKAVEHGGVDRFRLTGASEGAAISQVYGRVRLSGQVIWSSRFKERKRTERVETEGGGKGAPRQESTTYSYSVSLALALCEGEITRVGRIWADGNEIPAGDFDLRVYKGTEIQCPDPRIEAIEGAGNAPAYRGVAYVVIEDLELGHYGNRVPQFSFEVMRPEQPRSEGEAIGLARSIRGVALMPGTGEYALATTPVHFSDDPGRNRSANVNSPSGRTDLVTSLDALRDEVPTWQSTSLVVSWFGDDLRCGQCSLRPKVERRERDGVGIPWTVSGLPRKAARQVPYKEGRPVYGGTPTDQSVIQAIRAIAARGSATVFYPFILMDQMDGNGLPDPWSDASDQPALPWRGRITLSAAPGRPGSPDGSVDALAEVAQFFGTASPEHFVITGDTIAYTGPPEWSFRRFILHNAFLCVAAGGVDAFCIGSEMRGLTQIRDEQGFPAVDELKRLAQDVRKVLGPDTRIGYAADWSEYFGYQPQDGSDDLYFHLDTLWADPSIDFIGIDNYMPLSDWRDGLDHADAAWGSIYNLDYLKANIAGGEGFDWYYADAEAEARQERTPITDGAYGEPWVYRYKDLVSWWSEPHHERRSGVRAAQPTEWQPQSKPIWFTELGCAAIDKGTNEPNKFLDPKSSESHLPRHSTGVRDDLIQMQYLRAMFQHWSDPEKNPRSEVYGGLMVDMGRAHVWAWDARPYPQFPAAVGVWSDGENYSRGHWLTGRVSSRSLADVVAEICARSGVDALDLDRLHGVVRGYTIDRVDGARAALQPLMLAFGFDAVEREGRLAFRSRTGVADATVTADDLAICDELDADVEATRVPEAESAGRVRLTHVEADGIYEVRAAEAVFPDDKGLGVAHTELPLVLTQAEGRKITERWLAETRVSRDKVRLALPPSRSFIGAGDTIRLEKGGGLYRVDRVEQADLQLIEAVRVEPEIYHPVEATEVPARLPDFLPALPVFPVFLDLPLLKGNEVPHAPHLAASADPWPGRVSVFASTSDDGYVLNSTIEAASVIGETLTDLLPARAGAVDRGPALRVRLYGGTLSSATWDRVLNGANAAAVGDEAAQDWEVLQFASADLVGPNIYDLRLRLRGQAGTDYGLNRLRLAGSRFVLLDGAPVQVDLPASARGLERHWRIGPAFGSYDDTSYTHEIRAFAGAGLRPYMPAHLRVRRRAGNMVATWTRRSRIEGDSWAGYDVPLDEPREIYLVRILAGGLVVREATADGPAWSYSAAMQAEDGIARPWDIAVAQVSDRYGPGPFARRTIR